MAQLEVRSLTYRYPKGRGVSGISFSIAQGQVACLLGPSGSGKSTLLKLIAGFIAPQEGSIMLGDRLLADTQRALPAQERRIGLVFQHHALFPHLTVAENVLFGCKRQGAERTAMLEGLLNDFGIGAYTKHYPHTLSGGEQQRVALARALAAEPQLLLMDEPFSGLDEALRQHVRQQCLRIIRERGMTTLLVTHDEQEAALMGGENLIRLSV